MAIKRKPIMSDVSFEKLVSNKQNLERILDNLKEGIIAHDMHRRIFFFNQEAERLTGYSREEVLGKDCHEVFGVPFCGEQCSFCNSEPFLEDRKEYTVNTPTKNGESRRVEVTVTSMQDENGRNFGVLASLKDITDLFCLQIRAEQRTRFANIIGRDDKMLQVFKQIRDVADYDYPVHIYGETGTGKELVASAIHNESSRIGSPFVPINCGALPEGLLESELFGHVKGAFSGAIRDKKGRFELADGGTIFLDEVAELSKHMQVKLLRFLQTGTFEKVGDENTISINARVISATNKNLLQQVKQNNFRDDLYYRLNVIPIEVPPLRKRKNDIALLISYFLREAKERHVQKNLQISKEALALMIDYRWPGNVRELQNTIQYATVKCQEGVITAGDLPIEFSNTKTPQSRRGPSKKLNIDDVKSTLIKTGGNKAKAAKFLGVGRATLYRFLGDYPEALKKLT
jgi:PAS domain S-box-containing protein